MKKFLLNLAVFFLIILLANLLFGYYHDREESQAILNRTHSKYLQYNDLHDPKNEYDIIFLGSSRGHDAYNPVIFDSVLQASSFNMCTGGQNIIETYYILKEILRFQRPKTIVYEIFLPSFNTTNNYHYILSNARFMSNEGALDMIIDGFGLDGVANYCFPILRHKYMLKKQLAESDIFRRTHSSNRVDFQYIKGYIPSSAIVTKANIQTFKPIYSFTNTQISDKKLKHYFAAFVELCDQNEIELICVTAPYPPTRLKLTTTDSASCYFKEACTDFNVPYIDFNYLNDDEYVYQDTDFTDHHHMNFRGANKVSMQLAKIMAGPRPYDGHSFCSNVLQSGTCRSNLVQSCRHNLAL